ncbi:hypothetical protein CEXT_419151 [Caerostris extrusa]|uniref:Uncharacterized protein n=1 Tax=Caerostris extrusa TaxID=172846 RepID=A0AAV4RRZ9_CAEEX|nr:hypothetical protein CEXT_419151 [Caerostris extrusa]
MDYLTSCPTSSPTPTGRRRTSLIYLHSKITHLEHSVHSNHPIPFFSHCDIWNFFFTSRRELNELCNLHVDINHDSSHGPAALFSSTLQTQKWTARISKFLLISVQSTTICILHVPIIQLSNIFIWFFTIKLRIVIWILGSWIFTIAFDKLRFTGSEFLSIFFNQFWIAESWIFSAEFNQLWISIFWISIFWTSNFGSPSLGSHFASSNFGSSFAPPGGPSSFSSSGLGIPHGFSSSSSFGSANLGHSPFSSASFNSPTVGLRPPKFDTSFAASTLPDFSSSNNFDGLGELDPIDLIEDYPGFSTTGFGKDLNFAASQPVKYQSPPLGNKINFRRDP